MKTLYYCIFLLLALTVSADARIWTAKTSHTIDGEFVQLDGGTVTIRLPDGNTARIPLDQLSDGDQKYVASQINPPPIVHNRFGFNTPRDVLEREAQKGNPEALYYLARRYAQGWNGCPKDKKKSDELYQKGTQSADVGNPFAQCCRAVCYLKGIGVDQDAAEAVKWFRKAADQGNAAGQCALGICYAQGEGVPQDDAEAVKWFRFAAVQGEAEAQCFFGTRSTYHPGLRDGESEVLNWYRKSAEQGFAPGQYLLGTYYGSGQGIVESRGEAMKWYRKAAEQGFAEAQFMLGVCYAEGDGVPLDKEEAVKWYRLAAEQGEERAASLLRDLENTGGDTPKPEPPQPPTNKGATAQAENTGATISVDQTEFTVEEKVVVRYSGFTKDLFKYGNYPVIEVHDDKTPKVHDSKPFLDFILNKDVPSSGTVELRLPDRPGTVEVFLGFYSQEHERRVKATIPVTVKPKNDPTPPTPTPPPTPPNPPGGGIDPKLLGKWGAMYTSMEYNPSRRSSQVIFVPATYYFHSDGTFEYTSFHGTLQSPGLDKLTGKYTASGRKISITIMSGIKWFGDDEHSSVMERSSRNHWEVVMDYEFGMDDKGEYLRTGLLHKDGNYLEMTNDKFRKGTQTPE